MDAKKNLLIDLAALAVYALAANPALTGIGLHEWVGLGLLLVFLVHVAVHVDWVGETVHTAFRASSRARLAHLALDVLIVVTFGVCTVSGLLISGTVLPAFGLYAEGYYFWDPLHAVSAKALLALLLVHVVAHAAWFARLLKKGARNDDKEER